MHGLSRCWVALIKTINDCALRLSLRRSIIWGVGQQAAASLSGFTSWNRDGAGGWEALINGCMCRVGVCRYSIERTSDLDKYFYIDITSGALMTVRTLDREEMSWHNITVLAMEMSECLQVTRQTLLILHLEGERPFWWSMFGSSALSATSNHQRTGIRTRKMHFSATLVALGLPASTLKFHLSLQLFSSTSSKFWDVCRRHRITSSLTTSVSLFWEKHGESNFFSYWQLMKCQMDVKNSRRVTRKGTKDRWDRWRNLELLGLLV